MKRVLRDMRYLAADMARRDMRVEAGRLLEMSVLLLTIKQAAPIRAWRAKLLVMQDTLNARHLPKLQDALFRAHECGLRG